MQRRREEKGKEDWKSPKSGKGGEERNEEMAFSPLMTRAGLYMEKCTFDFLVLKFYYDWIFNLMFHDPCRINMLILRVLCYLLRKTSGPTSAQI